MRGVTPVVLLAMVAACADSRVQYERELSDAAQQSLATIVIAKGLVGADASREVFINGNPKCALDDKTYCILKLPPGSYQVGIDLLDTQKLMREPPKKRITVPIDLSVGEVSFVRVESEVQMMIPIFIPGVVIGTVGRVKIFLGPMTKEDFFRIRPQIDRVHTF